MSDWKDEITFTELWQTGEEKVWEEMKKCILDILHLKRQLDIQTEKLSSN